MASPSDVVLRARSSGGLAPVERPPSVTIYSDGVVAIAESSGPVPRFRLSRLTPAGLEIVLTRARAAGLMDTAAPGPASPDAVTTEVVVVGGGHRYVTLLGMTTSAGSDVRAAEFLRSLDNLAGTVGVDHVTASLIAESPRVRLSRRAYSGADPNRARSVAQAWPVSSVDLATAPCSVLSGANADAVRVALRAGSNQLWTQRDVAYTVVGIALLPDEADCDG